MILDSVEHNFSSILKILKYFYEFLRISNLKVSKFKSKKNLTFFFFQFKIWNDGKTKKYLKFQTKN